MFLLSSRYFASGTSTRVPLCTKNKRLGIQVHVDPAAHVNGLQVCPDLDFATRPLPDKCAPIVNYVRVYHRITKSLGICNSLLWLSICIRGNGLHDFVFVALHTVQRTGLGSILGGHLEPYALTRRLS